MARIRTIKPDFFRHEGLYEVEKASGLPVRLAFAGLWTAADREGRFVWAPRTLKLDCLPHDDLDFGAILDALLAAGFIQKYIVDGKTYGLIPSWHEHQHVNQREAASKLPSPDSAGTCAHMLARGEGKGKEGKDAASSDAHRSDEAELFDRGKKVLGKDAGGLIAKLLKSKKEVPLARAAIEMAATKQNPREYIGRVLSGPARAGPVLMENGQPYPDGII